MFKKRSFLGWSSIILGLLLLAFSVFSFIDPAAAIKITVLVYSCLIILSGLTDVLYFNQANEYSVYGSWLFLISGVISVICGFTFLFNVGLGEWVLSIMFPIWFIFRCVVQLLNLKFVRAVGGTSLFVMSIIFNILGIFLGVVMIVSPFAAEFALVYTIAIYSLLIGVMSISVGFSSLGQK